MDGKDRILIEELRGEVKLIAQKLDLVFTELTDWRKNHEKDEERFKMKIEKKIENLKTKLYYLAGSFAVVSAIAIVLINYILGK